MRPHRRQFIRGQWVTDAAASIPVDHAAEIASVLVQARPERLASVQAAIEGIAGADIAQRDDCGKLVVVLDSIGGQSIGESLTQISLMPHVLSATLVFHGVDTN
jgi:periplasmic nitrate reductase NapD